MNSSKLKLNLDIIQNKVKKENPDQYVALPSWARNSFLNLFFDVSE